MGQDIHCPLSVPPSCIYWWEELTSYPVMSHLTMWLLLVSGVWADSWMCSWKGDTGAVTPFFCSSFALPWEWHVPGRGHSLSLRTCGAKPQPTWTQRELNFCCCKPLGFWRWLLTTTLLIQSWLIDRAKRRSFCCCSLAKSCPTFCDPVDCSTAGSPVLHCLLDFVIHVHWVSVAI